MVPPHILFIDLGSTMPGALTFKHIANDGRRPSIRSDSLGAYIGGDRIGSVRFVAREDGELQVTNVEIVEGWRKQGYGTRLVVDLLERHPGTVLTGTSFSDEGRCLRLKMLVDHGVTWHEIQCFKDGAHDACNCAADTRQHGEEACERLRARCD